MLLFEDREHLVYMYRSVLLLYLLVAYYARDLRDGIRELGKTGKRKSGDRGTGTGVRTETAAG
jgi:hypothetical protein